jgi:hypothetical protein
MAIWDEISSQAEALQEETAFRVSALARAMRCMPMHPTKRGRLRTWAQPQPSMHSCPM